MTTPLKLNQLRDNPFYASLNLGTIERAIAVGTLDAAVPMTEASLQAAGLVRSQGGRGVRLLAQGTISKAITITVSGASQAARAAVEAAGGTVTTTVAKQEAPEA